MSEQRLHSSKARSPPRTDGPECRAIVCLHFVGRCACAMYMVDHTLRFATTKLHYQRKPPRWDLIHLSAPLPAASWSGRADL